MNSFFICSVMGWVLGTTCGSEQSVSIERPPYRLPGDIEPRHYDLDISTGVEEDDFMFWGSVLIRLYCVEDTDKIVIHSNNLTIDEKNVTLAEELNPENLKKINIVGHSYDTENEYYITQTESKLQAGKTYTYFIPFVGVLAQDLAGFYRSSYVDRDTNATKWLATTQFESIDARKAFPCFDEPKMKATYTITLGHPEKYSSISNMPLEESTPMPNKPGWVRDRYKKSVPMSTYLVAFVVSDFTHREAMKTENGVIFRVWAREAALNQTDFANQFGPKVLDYYEKYFSTEYPLPKQDMIAIPDFSAGAMENWGLITYRETALLFDPKASSSLNQERIASVVAHELAHQWFGNLVTMEWWTDLWLNEGFATYVATIGLHHLYPEWNSLVHEVTDNLLTVFDLDSLKSSHPVSVPIGHPNEIAQIFDTISYEKGSCVLRMMNLFLGEDVFRAGVSHYLNKHKYGNAKKDDLWAALTEIAHEKGVLEPDTTVKMIMDTWTVQTGYPILTVRRQENGDVIVDQKRYLGIVSSPDGKDMQSACWRVPLSYTSQEHANFSDTRPRKWLTCDGPLTIAGLNARDDKWIIFNIQVSALYRVNYDLKNWNLLASALADENNFKKIHILNRMQLVADAMDLAWKGELDYKTAFSVCKYLSHESDYVPWSAAQSSLNDIDTMLRRTPNYGIFKAYYRDLLTPTYNKAGSLTDTPKDFEGIKMKNMMIGLADRYEIGGFKDQAVSLFKKWYTHKSSDTVNPIPKDFRAKIYCTAMKNGGDDEWAFLWSKYLKSNLATEKTTILTSLGCTRKVWLLNRFLEWSIDSSSGIRSQDSMFVFAAVASNEVGFGLAKDFFMRRVADIFTYHGSKNSKMGRYVKTLSGQMISRDEYDEMKQFIEKYQDYFKFSGLEVKQALETIDLNCRWHEKHYAKMPEYLSPSV